MGRTSPYSKEEEARKKLTMKDAEAVFEIWELARVYFRKRIIHDLVDGQA